MKFKAVPQFICILLGTVVLFYSCKEKPDEQASSDSGDDSIPVAISWQIVKEYPHDPAAFTEGLQFIDSYLYESTGEYGTSGIRRTDLETGKILQEHKLADRYFGEGLTVLHGKIYQLTYKEHTGFVYDRKTFKQLKTFSTASAEAWGMTTDGSFLIYGDGSNTLYYLDTNTLAEAKRVTVTDEHGAVNNINELEYIKGFIYANQWQTDNILKIDPASGKVVARADLSDLREKTGIPRPSGINGSPEVMNGIAYDAATNRLFITGKYWPKLLEIKLDN